ncbi:tyrosine-type recombinase/integrase [Micromonospora sp. KLBMP9576]|uniref:tyrosine-type recombinase/integrase n=1 Tax=Micromonospora sp. KLBMP9576 TaxID=3424769 RepID=UPI003D9384A4
MTESQSTARSSSPSTSAARRKKHGGFHALRHLVATTLITNHVEPREVRRLLRHRTLRVTLETYVHWLPKREKRPSGVIGSALSAAAEPANSATIRPQDQE